MHISGSMLRTMAERVRYYLDEPSVSAKYDDDYIVRNVLGPSTVDVLSRLHNTSSSWLILHLDITLVDGVELYPLPPAVQQVLRLVISNTDGIPVYDVIPRSIYHRQGPGWSIEGNAGALVLRIQSPPLNSFGIQIWYVPSGDVCAHLGTGTLATAADVSTLTLGSTPTIGLLDRRASSYCGQVLRILPTSPAPIEETIIDTHYYSSGSWKVTTRLPLTSANGTYTYEIVPAASHPMMDAIALHAAMRQAIPHKIPGSVLEHMRIMYKQSLKTIGDNLTNLEGRLPYHIVKDTIDNVQGSLTGGLSFPSG